MSSITKTRQQVLQDQIRKRSPQHFRLSHCFALSQRKKQLVTKRFLATRFYKVCIACTVAISREYSLMLYRVSTLGGEIGTMQTHRSTYVQQIEIEFREKAEN